MPLVTISKPAIDLAPIAGIIQSRLLEINNPVITRQKKAIFQAALANLFDDNINMMPLQTPQAMAEFVRDNQFPPKTTVVQDNQLSFQAGTSHQAPQPAPFINLANVGQSTTPNDDDEEDLAHHEFESPFMHLRDLRQELETTAFPGVSKGTRGLVSSSIVSDVDFSLLEPWEIPGLPFDFGDGHSLKEATAMLTNDRLENNLGLPESEFSLRQVNEYLRSLNKRQKKELLRYNLMGKMNRHLGSEFYQSYQSMNFDDRVLTAKDITVIVNLKNQLIILYSPPFPLHFSDFSNLQ